MNYLKPKIQKKAQSKQKDDSVSKGQSEIQKLELKMVEIQKQNEYFKENPEEHELYKGEWAVYWERRCKELTRIGKDPKHHEWTEEWTDYWHDFIQKHYDRLTHELKAKIKYLLQVAENTENRLSKSYECISSSESEDDYGRDKRRRTDYNSSCKSSKSVENIPAPTSLISVLRILSVLEDDLGSVISNKVLDLLSKSLELERAVPNSSDEILMTYENVLFLETIKEKLKGLLMVDMLSSKKIAAVKKCIQNIAQLIHQTPARDESSLDPERQKITDMIEKEVAVYGKADLTSLELDVLVDVYLEMKEIKSKELEDFSAYESLTQDDLKVLMDNFSELKEDERKSLTEYLTYMRKKELTSVEHVNDNNFSILLSDDEFDDDELTMTKVCSSLDP